MRVLETSDWFRIAIDQKVSFAIDQLTIAIDLEYVNRFFFSIVKRQWIQGMTCPLMHANTVQS